MRKGIKLRLIIIDHGKMTAYDENNEVIKLTRIERAVMGHYKSDTYIEEIKHMFCNPNIIADDFRVVSDGKDVFRYNK